MSLVHRVDIVLMHVVSIVLVLEDLRQDSLGARRLTLVVDDVLIAIALDAHASTVDGIELVLDASISPR